MAFIIQQGSRNRQTNLFCFSAHTTQNQYSPNKILHRLSPLYNYVSQMQSLGNYLCPLFLHELQDKADIVWSFLWMVWLLDSKYLIEQTQPPAKQIIQ